MAGSFSFYRMESPPLLEAAFRISPFRDSRVVLRRPFPSWKFIRKKPGDLSSLILISRKNPDDAPEHPFLPLPGRRGPRLERQARLIFFPGFVPVRFPPHANPRFTNLPSDLEASFPLLPSSIVSFPFPFRRGGRIAPSPLGSFLPKDHPLLSERRPLF